MRIRILNQTLRPFCPQEHSVQLTCVEFQQINPYLLHRGEAISDNVYDIRDILTGYLPLLMPFFQTRKTFHY